MKQQRKAGETFLALLLLMLAGIGCFSEKVQAASASVSFSAETDTVALGEELSIEVKISTDSKIGSLEAYLDYDHKLLEYLTGADGVTGGNGTLKIADTITEEDVLSKSYQITFRAKKKGTCILEFSELPVVFEADTEEAMSVSYEDISIQVTKAKVLSNNTALESLQVSPGTLEPSFAKNVREYKVFLGADTDRITVSAVPEDSQASVSVRGNEALVEGENLVFVVVEAPSGKKKKYRIYVQKETKEEEEPEEETETEPEEPGKEKTASKESKEDFRIIEKNGAVVLKNRTKYTLVSPEEDVEIPAGYVKTKLILYGVTVNAYTLEQDLENDFILMYAKKDGEEPQFYQYDRAEKTMQRFHDALSGKNSTKIVVGQETETLSVNEYNKKVQKLSVIVGVSAALAVLFALGMLNFAIKYYSAKAGKSGKMDDFYR